MRNDKLISFIKNPRTIGKQDIADMRISLQAFPYFTSMQLLFTRGLYNTDSITYNRQLRKSAAFAGDRKLLFKLITKKKYGSENIKHINTEDTKITQNSNELNIGKPLDFSEDETHSFSEWLALTKARKIERKEVDLVDKFIESGSIINKPKREKFFSPSESAKISLVENDEIVTETLARVYLEQGHLDKSIQAYKKLSLKFPQKSSFFANQIKLIYDLKEK